MNFTECYQDTRSAVALAVRRGNLRHLRRLLKKGFSVDVKDNRGWNPLHEAAAAGSARCVRLLLAAADGSGDYVNSLTHDSETSLYLAAKFGHLQVVRRLIRAGADPNKVSDDLSGPLFAAVDGGHKEVVRLLVAEGAKVNELHSLSGWSCLHQAVYKGHSDIVKFLVSVCCIEPVDDYGITPLFVAAQYGRRRCLQILAEAGANVNCQAKDLATPLLIAAQEGHLTCVDLLLARGADPNLYCNEDQWQLPIHAAAEFNRISVLERLIPVTERGCDRDPGKVSPVYLAVLSGRVDGLRRLLDAGYSADAQSCHQFGHGSPLDMALRRNSQSVDADLRRGREVTRALLTRGARVSPSSYLLALRGGVDLPLILQHAGLPRGPALQALVQEALQEVTRAPHWLPALLRAGLDPLLLTQPKMLEEAESDALSLLLEFINWTTLPSAALGILSRRHGDGSWTPQRHLENVPALAHLCRLALRAAVGSRALCEHSFVQRLPVPARLQEYLQFRDVLGAHGLGTQNTDTLINQ